MMRILNPTVPVELKFDYKGITVLAQFSGASGELISAQAYKYTDHSQAGCSLQLDHDIFTTVDRLFLGVQTKEPSKVNQIRDRLLQLRKDAHRLVCGAEDLGNGIRDLEDDFPEEEE
jgi:hypothetical protein